MTRVYLVLGALIALMLGIKLSAYAVHRYGDHRYEAGVTDGRNAMLADNAKAAAQAQDTHDALASFSAFRGARLADQINATLPTIEATSHAAAETVRTIYRDRPVPVDTCTRPVGVQQQLDQAVDRANAAASAASGHL